MEIVPRTEGQNGTTRRTPQKTHGFAGRPETGAGSSGGGVRTRPVCRFSNGSGRLFFWNGVGFVRAGSCAASAASRDASVVGSSSGARSVVDCPSVGGASGVD